MIKSKYSLLFLVLFFLATGCRSSSDMPKDGVVRVGALFPMTGNLADKGIDSVNGIKLAVEEINANGGILALDGAKIELVIADTQGKPDIGVMQTEKIINENKVCAIIGTYQSSVTKPATQVAEKMQTPFIVSISLADVITERGFKYTFRVEPKAQFYANDQVSFLVHYGEISGKRIKRIALLHENSDFGTSTSLNQKRALRDHGFDVVADVPYIAESAKNLDREVSYIVSKNPDAVLMVTYFNDSILVCKAFKKTGVTFPIIDTAGGTVSADFIPEMGRNAEGIFSLVEYSKYSTSGKLLNDRFHKIFDVDITGDSAYSYQSMLVLKNALERAGSINREKLRAALSKTELMSGPEMILPSEKLKFDSDGQNEFARLYIVQIQHGEMIPVWPLKYAAGKIILPGKN